MKICSINELVNSNFDVVFINALKQLWKSTKSFQCINAPKKENLFLYVNGYTIIYTDKNNNTFVAESGDIVYTPAGSEYKVKICGNESAEPYTIGINFLLPSEDGEQLILSDNIKIFCNSDKAVSMLFHQMLSQDNFQPLIRKKIILMEILCALASGKLQKNIPESIIRAVQYLSENIEKNPTIAEMAGLCNISEVYFRKLFKKHMGITPREYRNILRLDKAASYLEYGDVSVQEISDMLGYATVSYFIKDFRTHYGCSPLQYRKRLLN